MARAAEAKKAPPAKPAPAVASAGLGAAQIAERNVKARGGLKAWRAVRALKMTGEVEAGGTADPKLPYTLYLQRPRRSRLELTFAGQNAVQVYDGTQGWKLRPYLNRDEVEPFRPEELAAAGAAADLDAPLVDYAAKGTRIELVGTEAVEGKKAYKLALTLAGRRAALRLGGRRHLPRRQDRADSRASSTAGRTRSRSSAAISGPWTASRSPSSRRRWSRG